MESKEQELVEILQSISTKEKKIHFFSILFVIITVTIGIVISYITVEKIHQLKEIKNELNNKNEELNNLRIDKEIISRDLKELRSQLEQARMAHEYINLAIDSLVRKNYKAAIHYYDKAIAFDPNNPNTFNLKGYALLLSGNPKQAIIELQNSIKLDSNYVWSHYNLSLAYFANSDYDNAIEQLRIVIKINPEFKDVIRNDRQFIKYRILPEYLKLFE